MKRKKRKHHTYQEWIKMREKMGEADIRQKTGTKIIADFLRRVVPTTSSEQPSKAPDVPPQKTRRETQTDVTSASLTTSLPAVIPSTS